MDHKVSKDMISSGMIPSGKKTQADLGRIQYGSAPSPSSLMEAYRSIYEHHQKDADGKVIEHDEKEELNEGKVSTLIKGLSKISKLGQKAAVGAGGVGVGVGGGKLMHDSAKDAKNKKKVEEGMGSVIKAGVKAVKKIKKTMGDKPSPEPKPSPLPDKPSNPSPEPKPSKKPDMGSKPVSQMNDVDLFDLIKGRLIDEGCDEQEAIKIMTNLTEDELNQISEGLPLLAKGALAVGGAVLAKKGIDKAKKGFDNFLNKQRDKGIGGNTRPGSDKMYYGK